MGIPIISGYIEKRRTKAKEELRKLRDFYKKENNPLFKYDRNRKIIFLKGNEKKPIKLLRKIKIRLEKVDGWYNWESIKQEINNFQKLSQEERIKRAKDQIRKNKIRKLEFALRQWAKNAEPILEEIIEQNPEQMIGFEYYNDFHGGSLGVGPIYARIVKKDKGLPIYFEDTYQGGKFYTQSLSYYGEGNWISETPAKEIVSKILKQVVPDPLLEKDVVYLPKWVSDENQIPKNEVKVIDFSKGIDKSRIGWLAPHRKSGVLVEKRNQIVKDIEKRTGRNLKKEVSASRYKK